MSSELYVQNVYDGFFTGGARIAQTTVTIGLHGDGQRHGVVAINNQMFREDTVQLMAEDHCHQRLIDAGVAVTSLGLCGSATIDYGQTFTAEALDRFRGAVDGADVLASLKEPPLRLLRQAEVGDTPVVACLHRSDPEHQEGGLQELLASIAAGRIALCTISGVSARAAYIAQGVPADKIRTIPNGVDLSVYKGSQEHRTRTLGIDDSAPVVLFVARYDGPMKNIPLFLQSARFFLDAEPDAHVVMCGTGITIDNPHFQADVTQWFGDDASFDVRQRIHYLGPRRDMHAIYPAGDVLSLTSQFGETEPLVILEAMASATKEFGPVPVATDVGDTQLMLGDGRGVITPNDSQAIADAWRRVCKNKGDFLSIVADPATREAIDVRHMIAAYGRAFEDAARR